METTPQSTAVSETRVCLVEDDALNREALVRLLNSAPGLRCVAAYSNGEDAVRGIPGDDVHVALVDIRLPGISGIECIAQLRRQIPRLEALMLTVYEEPDMIFDSLRAGAKGYLLKNAPPAELIQAIEQIRLGGAPMSVQIARKVVNYFDCEAKPAAKENARLTKRENDVLALLARGFLYKEIGDQLGISPQTVKTHLHSIYEKLHVQSRTEAVIRYLRK